MPALFGGPREADYVRPLWESFGIARDRILLERDSRNTVENATMTKALVNPKPGERWLLVTSSWHMPRAVGVFRQAGFQVEPYPVDWISTGDELRWLGLSKSFAGGLHAIDNAAHEWVGMLVYWLTGRSSEFFPGAGANGRMRQGRARIAVARRPYASLTRALTRPYDPSHMIGGRLVIRVERGWSDVARYSKPYAARRRFNDRRAWRSKRECSGLRSRF